MTHRNTVPTIGKWAAHIELSERSTHSVIVTGLKHPIEYSSQCNVAAADDLLGRFWRDDGLRSVHFKFLNIDNEDEMVYFIGEHGPIEGKRISMDELDLDAGTVDVKVRQSLSVAMALQRRYATLLDLIQTLQRRPAASEILRLCECVDELKWKSTPTDNTHEEVDLLYQSMLEAHRAGRDELLAGYAHKIICIVLSQFPVRLVAYEEGAIELPQREMGSIMPELAYMLRLEYLKEHHIRRCANERCWNPFRAMRKGARFCCEDCSRQQRQREYWAKKGSKRRRIRRSKKRMLRKK